MNPASPVADAAAAALFRALRDVPDTDTRRSWILQVIEVLAALGNDAKGGHP